MVAKNLKVGDLVWAKMKGFPAWPARIIHTPADAKSKPKKDHHYVYFFGSDNHACIMDDNIVPHTESMLETSGKKRSAALQRAVEALVKYQQGNDKPSTVPDKAVSQVEKEPRKKKNADNVGKKHAEKEIQPSKKVKVTKTPKKRRHSLLHESDDDGSEISLSKRSKINDSDGSESSLSKSSKINDSDGSESSLSKSSVSKRGKSKRSNDSDGSESSLSKSSVSKRSKINDSDGSESSLSKRSKISDSDEYSDTDIDLDFSPVSSGTSSPVDNEAAIETLNTKAGTPTDKRIGFLGLGLIGKGIVANLLNSGHKVTVWNRTPGKVDYFVEAGANRGMTPADVVAASDITFCCLSNPEAAKALVFSNCGVLKALESSDISGKGYVEMTCMDPDTSRDIAEAITSNRGKYLEAPIIGSKKQADEGNLFILAAGDRSLFTDCESCFRAMGNHAYYISHEFPNGSKMNLILSMFYGITYAALSEAMALVDKAKLSQEDFIEILSLGSLNCQAVLEKGHAILTKNFSANTPLKHVAKDMYLALIMGNTLDQPLPLAAAANEVYKRAKLRRYADHDVCALYMSSKY